MEGMQAGTPAFVYVEVVGSLVGLGLMVYLISIARRFGGAMGSALRVLLVGVGMFTLAFVFSAVVDLLQLFPMQNSMAIHMSLMIVAMIMIALTTSRLAGLLK